MRGNWLHRNVWEDLSARNYLKLKCPLGATDAWWDLVLWRDMIRRNPQGTASSAVTYHLHKKNCIRETHPDSLYSPNWSGTWCGSEAILFLNCWNTLLSSVSCKAISSRSASSSANRQQILSLPCRTKYYVVCFSFILKAYHQMRKDQQHFSAHCLVLLRPLHLHLLSPAALPLQAPLQAQTPGTERERKQQLVPLHS